MKYPGFIGGDVRARSRTVDSEWTVNLYLEHSNGTPKQDPAYYGRPVLRPWTSCAPGPIRGLFYQDGIRLAVSGNYAYRVYDSRNVEVLGEVAVSSTPVTFACNGVSSGGQQVALASGGNLYVYDIEDETFDQVTGDNVPDPCVSIAFSDGYGIGLNSTSNKFQLSALEDFTTWSGLDVAQTSVTSDDKIALAVSHREVWLLGSQTTVPYYNSGDAAFPYQVVQGVLIEKGIIAPFTLKQQDNTLYWLGQDKTGSIMVFKANGYNCDRVSDHAIETVIAKWSNIRNSYAFVLTIEGHAWYCLQNPSSLTTLVYDITSQTWTDFAQWDNRFMQWVPFVGGCEAWDGHRQLIGMRAIAGLYSGVIYSFEMNPADGLWQDKICWPVGA